MTGMLNAAVGRSSLRFLAMGSDPLLGFVLCVERNAESCRKVSKEAVGIQLR